MGKRRYRVKSEMKKKILLFGLFASFSAFALRMEAFIQKHYEDDASAVEVKRDLTPSVSIGRNAIEMEVDTLKKIQKLTAAPVMQGNQYQWLCVKTNGGMSYGFISDNEMGNGTITAIALLENGEGCKTFDDPLIVTVKGVPLPEATSTERASAFGQLADFYYKDTPVKGGLVQSNDIRYYSDEGGVILNQITVN
ncbi:hypothetical protein ACI09V_002991 [Cronobacter dublinensis]